MKLTDLVKGIQPKLFDIAVNAVQRAAIELQGGTNEDLRKLATRIIKEEAEKAKIELTNNLVNLVLELAVRARKQQ